METNVEWECTSGGLALLFKRVVAAVACQVEARVEQSPVDFGGPKTGSSGERSEACLVGKGADNSAEVEQNRALLAPRQRSNPLQRPWPSTASVPRCQHSRTGAIVNKNGHNLPLAECEVRSWSRPVDFIAPAF